MSDSGRQMREQCRDCGKVHDYDDLRTCIANLVRERDRRYPPETQQPLGRLPVVDDEDCDHVATDEHDERCGDS